MVQDFKLVQDLVDILCGVKLTVVPDTREGLELCMRQAFHSQLADAQKNTMLLRGLQSLSPDCIYELNGPVDLQFALFSCAGFLLVLGPCRRQPLTRVQLLPQLQQLHLDTHKLQQFADYCLQQPVVSYEKLHQLAALLAQHMLDSPGPIPFRQLDYHWSADRQRQFLQDAIGQDLEQVRRIEGRYEASAALTEAVKRGNLSLALRFVQQMGSSVPADLNRSSSPVRSAQNLCIVLNTQLRHALEEDGIPPYRLDQVSSSIALQIEKFKTLPQVNAYFSEILRLYCTLAQEPHQKELSPFARIAVTYIHTHLSDNITVKDAAKALLVNPDYLSAQFHRAVGIPFISYVNRERVLQASALLKRTDLQIQQISSVVGYNNTSYFARQFLRFQGMTPRAYRKSGQL